MFYLPLKEKRILKTREIEILFSNMTMLLGVNSGSFFLKTLFHSLTPTHNSALSELLKELEKDMETNQGSQIGATFCWMVLRALYPFCFRHFLT